MRMQTEIKKERERKMSLRSIESHLLLSLRAKGFEISDDAACTVTRNSAEIGIKATGAYMDKGFKIAFASDISISIGNPNDILGNTESEINFGSSGSFNPTVKESYWRTIHAATLLKNWDLAIEIISNHCDMIKKLQMEFM